MIKEIHSAEKHANSNGKAEHEASHLWDKLSSCVPFLQAAFVARSFSRWLSPSSSEGVHLEKRKALGCSSEARAHDAEEAPLLGLIKERFQIQTVPFQQGVLKWTFIKIRQKQQNTKSGIKLSTLKNAVIL